MKKWIAIFLFCLIASAGSYGYFEQFKKSKIHLNSPTQTFEIVPKTTFNQLIYQLNEEKIVTQPLLLKLWATLSPEYTHIKSGLYQLNETMSVEQLLALFISNEGRQAQFSVQFIEGTTIKEWLQVLSNKAHLQVTISPSNLETLAETLGIEGSLEGWFSPDTYFYTKGMSDLAILKRAHQQRVSDLNQVWENRDPDLPYKTPYELLIMASIIEKETGVASERRTVASVFVNRLKKGMKLQTDPTIIYGLGDRYQGTIYKSHLTDKSNPYNTYVIEGLPPTPISMPSRASLEAAAHPAQTDYLYFVASGEGDHLFSETYRQHLKAVERYRQIEREKKRNR